MKIHLVIFACFLSVFFLFQGISQSSDFQSVEKILDIKSIEKDAQLINLRMDYDKSGIFLDDTELIEDDAPAAGVPEGEDFPGPNWIENLKKGIVLKKILVLDNPAAFSGRILFKGIEVKKNKEPLCLSLNGVRFVRPPSQFAYPYAKQYTDYSPNDRWFFIDLPAAALKAGENELLMWADSDSVSWRVLISLEKEFARGSLTRTHHPNRSMKSLDGGKTWSDNKLGMNNSVDGEYSIRFSLDRHVKSGKYISPVMDITDDQSPLKRNIKIASFKFSAGIDTPKGTSASMLVRFGPSPDMDSSGADWIQAESEKEFKELGNKRYFQWKVEMTTSDPLVTPVLKNIKYSTEWENLSPNKKGGVFVEVINNGHITRSSYPFTYENLLHPELEKYRKNAKLDKIIEGASSEFEIMMRLLNWAYRIPLTSEEYSWNWNDVVIIEKGEKNMPRLQSDYNGRRRDAMCLYSNQALIGALLSMGYQARHINLNSEGASGHEVTEVWSNEYNKWIYMDATRDYYYFDKKTGIPLNMLELHNLLRDQLPRVETWQRPFIPEIKQEVTSEIDVGFREGVNKFSVEKDALHILEIMGYFRFIPRNDFLSNPLPVPVHTGITCWGWDGFLNHYDEKFPKRMEYQLQSNRFTDFYEPLNQAVVYLNETEKPGVLDVDVDTFTPGFDTFIVRLNDGNWAEKKQNSWSWPLKPGKNCIEVRTRNVRGIVGPVSKLLVTYNP